MGMFSRAQSIRRSETETPVVDNYEDFLSRMAVAQEALQAQSGQVSNRLQFLMAQRINEAQALATWKQRSEKLSAIIAAYSGGTSGYQKLADLSDTVDKLYNASKNRHETLSSICAALNEQSEAANANLTALTAARQQLETERRIGIARESITQAASETHTIAHPGIITGASNEGIREIKRLVAQAEALVELKRW